MGGKLLYVYLLLALVTITTCKPRMNTLQNFFRRGELVNKKLRITILSYSLLLLTYCAEITKGEDKRAIPRCTDFCSTYSNCQGFDAYGEYFFVYGRCPSGLVCCYYYKYSIDE
ncbi:unnamed protein product [Porites lobata]|uniref:Uncharacterized protein n=1 Tax=Porites lobata TaxID=104759 RepID=A0ABN8QZQ2_9CNID|nr:unnamed protein product [Porites lobata]